MVHTVERVIGGKTLTIQTGKLAGNADGAVMVRYGDTVLLVAACMSPQPRTGIDFFPLTVEFEERMYAAGKIPGGFIKREGRPSLDATLAARITDRTIRPRFPKALHNEVQVVITVLSADRENIPDVLGIVGASAALGLSSIPFNGPVSGVRVGLKGGQFVANPTYNEVDESLIDLIVAGSSDAVVMVEAGAKQVPESTMLDAIRFGHEVNREIIGMIQELIGLAGKPKVTVAEPKLDPVVAAAIAPRIRDGMAAAVAMLGKAEREDDLNAMAKQMVMQLEGEFTEEDVLAVFQIELKRQMRSNILDQGRRPDGRATTEVRPIWCEVGLLPRTHGSAVFTRGQTQILSVVTLGSPGDQQKLDNLSPNERKRYIHHYNFPPYSTGEVRRMGGTGRRELGHGALAERAVFAVLPEQEAFPYTIRIVSEAISSNGSTSMGSVCGSTLSLMDAGVPIVAPVSGVAMGLIMNDDGRFAVLTDIAGMEDHMGDMDFKVAGTSTGITALQMDIKVAGLPFPVLEQALAQAKDGRMFILGKMMETIQEARSNLSPYAPRLTTISIDPEKIRFLIGPGGKTIRSITEEAKVTIDVDNDGTVVIGSTSEEGTNKAIRMIEALTKEVEPGQVYTGKVTRTMNFGAFVEIAPGKEGMVHISELADYRVNSVEDVVHVGDEIMVQVIEIDRMGRINLSRRAAMESAEGGARNDGEGGEGEPRPVAAGGEGGPPRRFDGPRGGDRPRPGFGGGRPGGPPRGDRR
ncbi:MAG: polyribonucleotide nucleotidyltransferase [Dehalococcoidia bacterium]|nr:polyribonucleotide nucleotidyltransferase [Dehalococcoidia bacterium]